MSQTTRQIVSYSIKDGDSLEALARTFMGSAEDWQQLAILNSLDYPYISRDPAFVTQLYAAGTVTFTRTAGSTAAVTVPLGTPVFAPAGANSPQKNYLTTAAATLPLNIPNATAPIQALLAGEIGNAPPLTVTGLGVAIPHLGAVTNIAAVSGGQQLNVLVPGSKLLVFLGSDAAGGTVGVDTQSLQAADFFTALLGTDIALDPSGQCFADARGGLATVGGVANFQGALLRRIGTPLSWYVYNPSYGSQIEQSVGQRGDAYWLQRTQLEVIRTVRTDPRVSDVQNVRVTFQAGTLNISLDILTIGEKDARNLVFSLKVPGGV